MNNGTSFEVMEANRRSDDLEIWILEGNVWQLGNQHSLIERLRDNEQAI